MQDQILEIPLVRFSRYVAKGKENSIAGVIVPGVKLSQLLI